MLQQTHTQLLINGRGTDGASGRRLEVLNPATGTVVGTVACAGERELAAAVQAAVEGFQLWRRMPAFERAGIMRKAAALLRERVETVARLMTLEQGKPIAGSRAEVLNGAGTIEWCAEEGLRCYGRLVPPRNLAVQQMVLKEPVGPVAAFTPWNFPINQAVRKLAAALATGCSIIVKAPEETPASPAELLRAFVDAGVLAGVVGLVVLARPSAQTEVGYAAHSGRPPSDLAPCQLPAGGEAASRPGTDSADRLLPSAPF